MYKYTYYNSTQGCDETFEVCKDDGTHIASIHFWEQRAEAEANAKLVVDALNAYRPRKTKKKLSDYEKAITKAQAVLKANLRKPMPKGTPYKE